MPPQVNAALTDVATRGSSDDFHVPAPEDEAVFAGSLPAYYSKTRRRVAGVTQSGAVASDVLIDHTLLIDPPPFIPTEGQLVTFEFGGDTLTGVIQAVEAPDLPGVPDYLKTVRLTLEVG